MNPNQMGIEYTPGFTVSAETPEFIQQTTSTYWEALNSKVVKITYSIVAIIGLIYLFKGK
jgi:hypothetical protein